MHNKIIILLLIVFCGSTSCYSSEKDLIIGSLNSEFRPIALQDHALKGELYPNTFYYNEHFFWNTDSEKSCLLGRTIENEQGEIVLCRLFDYDQQNRLVKETLYGNLTGLCPHSIIKNPEGLPDCHQMEHYSIEWSYDSGELPICQKEENGNITLWRYKTLSNGSLQLDAQFHCEEKNGENHILSRFFYIYGEEGELNYVIEDNGCQAEIDDLDQVTNRHAIPYMDITSSQAFHNQISENDESSEYIYDSQARIITIIHSPLAKSHSEEDTTLISTETVISVISNFFSFFQNIFNQIQDFKESTNHFINELNLVNYLQGKHQTPLEDIFGLTFLELAGYYQEPEHQGIFGQGEKFDQIRITMLNGLFSDRDDIKNVQQLSEHHGNTNIHYIFRPTSGWTHDIIKGCYSRMGFVSLSAKHLADLWKQLIQELGGTDSNGLILHYAHSLGGSDTYLAKDLLTPEEQKMIRVVTVGSAIMVPHGGFEGVVNYVSRRDGVCLFVDPIGYIKGLVSADSNVKFLGSSFGIPFIDHALNGSSYKILLKELGEQFLKELGSQDTSSTKILINSLR